MDPFATTQPSWLALLGLLVGVPGVVFVLIAVLTKSPRLMQAARGEQPPDPSEPIWIPATAPPTGELTSSDTAPLPIVRDYGATDDVGGASVRW